MFVTGRKNGATLVTQSGPDFTALCLRVGSTNLRYVLGGGTLLALHDVELDLLAFGERLEAVGLDGRVVHEAILRAVRGRDEAEALGVVEPLDGAGRTHGRTPTR